MADERGADDDPFHWLEALDSAEATRWVGRRNAAALADLTSGRFAELRDEIRQVLDAEDRVPVPIRYGDRLYNLWKDRAHPRGLWRRTTPAEYRKPEPQWETVLDLDALAAAEGENWIWQQAAVLRPSADRCLLKLSRGGADATVVREFDLRTLTFVDDGFTLPEAKSRVAWIDADHLYVGTDFGPGTMTASGYPRTVRRWRRGTPLAQAPVVFEGSEQDVAVQAVHDPIPGYERDFVIRGLDFHRSEWHLRLPTGELVHLDVPQDARVDFHREWLLITLKSAWTYAGTAYPAGALLATDLAEFIAGGPRPAMTVLFEPTASAALSYHIRTRHHLILNILADVRSRLEVLTPDPAGWQRAPLSIPAPGAETPDAGTGLHHLDVADTDPDTGDDYLLVSSGYTQPATVLVGNLGPGATGGPGRAVPEQIKQAPAFFDAAGITVRQLFAVSADGTRVPYFVTGRAGSAPTLLSGYGGFEVSNTPAYSAVIGRGWLARGGTYVVANIRGGGEYGPQWHRAALRENRPRAYEDFAAVAADLVSRGITTPAQLGVEGRSNGGLLTGVMLTRYPELFGAVVSGVPLLDMKRYHRLLAGASWMAEYGDPDIEADWAFLRSFSPYHNVEKGRDYPPAYLYTSTRDDRVHPGHARKMAALLGEQGHDVTFYENVEGGHDGAADNDQVAVKWALMLEFLWQRLAP